MDVEKRVRQVIRPRRVHLPEGCSQRRVIGIHPALTVDAALVDRAQWAGAPDLLDLPQVVVVGREYCGDLRLPDGRADRHGAVCAQAPFPACPVHESGDAGRLQVPHDLFHRGKRPAPHSLGNDSAPQDALPVEIRRRRPEDLCFRALVGRLRHLLDFAHEIVHELLRDPVALRRALSEPGGVLVALLCFLAIVKLMLDRQRDILGGFIHHLLDGLPDAPQRRQLRIVHIALRPLPGDLLYDPALR